MIGEFLWWLPSSKSVPLCGGSKWSKAPLGKAKINSWEKLLKHTRAAFLPHNYVKTMCQLLWNLRQGTHSVDDYNVKFYRLVVRVDLEKSENQLVSRYIRGIKQKF
jgi:hypothetical protein